MLSRIYSAPGGTEALDVLMKYMYDPDILYLYYLAQHTRLLDAIAATSLADGLDLQLQGHGTGSPSKQRA